ncbi:DUF4082 domain-containing protein [Flavobacterium sp. RSB2_4_14]|uniref:DUF4082 domain-containing protein n=1 Tax=Flavobacterium sp. RSB2_4_14 TaxID=3447665 RepID=UPI003F3B52BF
MKKSQIYQRAIAFKRFSSLIKMRFLFLLMLFFISKNGISQSNPISIENALTGNPKSEWDINGSDDPNIQGFATQISVNTGQTIDFKIDVKAPATNYSIKIYRLGYYNGLGARLIADLGNFSGVAQPTPLYDPITGKTDCSNWSVSSSWNTGTFTSGLYLAKLTRTDTLGSSHIAFVVRNDNGGADMLFKTSDTTWQAYNGYGGNSLYVDNNGVPNFDHATKVSYNRPFNTRGGGGGSGASEDWLFNAEYPMIRWLERNGYNVSYTTDVDMDKDPKQITPTATQTTYGHKILLSVGHDEYWSIAERTKFENARDAGVHLAFFSGNEIYWKVRWEDDYRSLVCYKEGTLGENLCGFKCDTSSSIWTGLWRDGSPTTYSGSDGGKPENALSGQISWGDATGSIVVTDEYKNLRFWRNTSVATSAVGQNVNLPFGTLGYEFDFEQPQFASFNPKGRITMSNTNLSGKTHKLSLYRHSSGALVFGAGTVQWSWGLDDVHDRGNAAPSLAMQQATLNLFTDMGVSPATIQSELSIVSQIDITAPLSVITAPFSSANVPSNSTVTISGTASDTDGVVAGIEVSTDNGATWNVATGTTTWTYSWVPTTQGSVTIKSRAFDDNGNIEIPENGINITVVAPLPIVCPCSIFPVNSMPQNLVENDNQKIEVGMKFRSAVSGFIKGVRFYKATGDTGTHIGNLWNSNGTLLASVLFAGETASGWQQANFSGPVAITANTTYVISYHSSNNFYTSTVNGLSSAVTTGNLTALANGTDGPNGLYIYSSDSAFPTLTFNSSNYWVDVVFDTDTEDETPPSIIQVTPNNNASLVSNSTTVSATFSESIDSESLTNRFELRNASNIIVPATISYSNGTNTVTLTPINPLSYTTTYTAKLLAGIEDIEENVLTTEYSWTFTTSPEPQPTPIPAPDGPGGPILIISSSTNPFSRYPIEILRAEGINQFKAEDISVLNQTLLANYEVVILGEMTLSSEQVTLLTNWVNTGKTLITLRPKSNLYPLLGIASSSGTLSDKYLLFNTTNGPGVGLVDETIQYHSDADLYVLLTDNAPTVLATLYSSASTSTSNPAIISRTVGTGKVFAFAYDLAKSVVYTRQGNPAWAGQQRDDQNDGNIRSNDLFHPDWIDFNKVQIPQADEQQRLLSNIITQSILPKMPLPKFWFLPRKLKAAVVMTGDDHGNNGTAGRFDYYLTFGNNSADDVLNWRAIRGTSYMYPNTPMTNVAAMAYEAQGFEIALHLNSGCNVYTEASLGNSFTTQLAQFGAAFSGLSASKTHRTHCISWSDWASKPKVEIQKGIRLNTDYYYWPSSWVQNRPGMFTGSGMPMRFADLDGTILDNYQVTTQMPDESGLNISNFINTLLTNAKGTKGFYGVFCANMHTDNNNPGDQSVVGSNAIVASAVANEIPVITAKQMLTWLDGRNASTYSNISYVGSTLTFDVVQATGAHKLQGMIPVNSSNGQLLTFSVPYTTEIIKGINYAFFDAVTGSYTATYGVDNTPPTVTNILATPNVDGTVTITWTTDEPATSRVDYGTVSGTLNLNSISATLTTNHSIILTGLTPSTPYYFRITSADAIPNSVTAPIISLEPLSFTTPAGPCITDTTVADFTLGTATNTMVVATDGGGLSLNSIVNESFNGTSIPSGWQSFAWTGGTSTVSSGLVNVNGARLNTVAPTQTFGPGSVMEFVATFGADAFQHIGFGSGGDSTDSNGIYTGQSPWAMFSTGNQSTVLRARTSLNGATSIDVNLPGSLIGSSHLYRIEWNTNDIKYYVDGTLIHTQVATISETMRPAISDYNSNGTSISVDWIKVAPYVSSGTFTSQIFNVGTVKSWQQATWNASVPTGTTLTISQRQANSSNEITSVAWTPIPTSGFLIGGVSQFIQYKVEMATTNTSITPELLDISIACTNPQPTAPLITTQPLPQTVCLGSPVSFNSVATGNPIPSIQWQKSVGETNVWSNISGATTSPYTFTPVIGDNNTKYRAIWSNSEGIATSNVVLLTVNSPPVATLTALKNPICPGEPIELKLTNATGTGPLTIVVNGETYTDVEENEPFANFNTVEKSIWDNTDVPDNPNGYDGQPIEVGTKFRSTENGYITGVRFYKGISNTGTHTAKLYRASDQALLATAVFTSETASGWQEVRFATPVAITIGTTYITSCFSQNGYFAITPGYFANTSQVNPPLMALQSGIDGSNGVYKYGGGFPDGGGTANYWVDVLFTEVNQNDLTFNLTSITDGNCTNTNIETPLSTVTVTMAPLPNGTLTYVEPNVCEGSPVNLVFNATAGTGPFDLVVNGTAYSSIVSGVPFATVNATNTTQSTTVWTPATIGGSQTVDANATELGHRIVASIDGVITGIRFYKTATNTITGITGSLWAIGNSTPLATGTYTGDNTVGWKEIVFSYPVSITAGTPYMVSYFSPASNYYAFTGGGLNNPIVSGPLTVQSSFYKQPGPGYPNSNSTANYWVDVIFTPTSSNMNFNLTSITSSTSCTTAITANNTVAISVQPTVTYYADTDNDGYGDINAPQITCLGQPMSYVTNNSDCDDTNVAIHTTFMFYADTDGDGYGAGSLIALCAVDANTPPTAGFVSNNIDCAPTDVNIHASFPFYADTDGDGYGVGATVSVCAVDANTPPIGYSTNDTDCAPSDNSVHASFPFYADTDADGYGAGATVSVCAVDANTPPTGYSLNNTDCAPSDVAIHETFTFYVDGDGDGYGSKVTSSLCAASGTVAPVGYSLNDSDCDDSNTAIYQSASLYIDTDSDGYDNGQATVCYGATTPTGYATSTLGGDCDDADATKHASFPFYVDGDGDTYGAGTAVIVCAVNATIPPAGYSLTNTDCNDADPLRNPNNPCSSLVTVKIFIEGYYDVNIDGMRPVLANQGVGESTSDVDEVTIELHDATTYELVASTTAMLLTNGNAVATFSTAPSGSFYIAIRHRNSLETWSATAQTVGTTPLTYDFTDAANKAYGDNMKELESGVFGFYSGDLNQDGFIEGQDFPFLSNASDEFYEGYQATDLNGDGFVEGQDFPYLSNNSDNFIETLHP